MSLEGCLRCYHHRHHHMVSVMLSSVLCCNSLPISNIRNLVERPRLGERMVVVAQPLTSSSRTRLPALAAALSSPPPLDLTEDNVRQVLDDARAELAQIFDSSVGITGQYSHGHTFTQYMSILI
jgi:hypothetical protein